MTRRLPGPALLALACLWLGATAWLRPLALPDEGRYVGVAWEMVRSGDWLTPTLDGLPYFHKPPLFYWLTAAALSVAGNVEGAGRVAPWLGSCLMACSAWLFAARWLGPAVARAWLLVLVTMPLALVGAQYANLDMLVAGCITACVLAHAHALLLPADDPGRRRWQLAGAALAAAGVLAKGLIGVVLPGLVLVAWIALRRRPRDLLVLLWWPALLLFLALAAPWFLAMQQRFPGFLHYFFVVHHVGRFTHAAQTFNNARPAWFYPLVLALLCLPWTAWLAARRPPPADDTQRAIRWLAWAWLAAVLVFFSLPRSKLVGYILPAVPPLALLLAQGWLAQAARHPRWATAGRACAWVAAALCIGAVVAATRVPVHESGRLLAPHIAAQPRPLVAVEIYPFDLPFYARLRTPFPVIDRWDDAALVGADNWRRELAEAGAFRPGAALLQLPAVLARPNCPGGASWVVGPPSAAGLGVLAGAREVARGGGLVLWDVRDWQPGGCAGTPNPS